MKTYSIEEINETLKGLIVGNTGIKITAPEQLELANDSEISFIGHKNMKNFGNPLKPVLLL